MKGGWLVKGVTAVVLLFLYAPIVMVTVNSFNADPALIDWQGFTTDWYSDAVANPRVRDAALTSVTIAFVTTAISLVIAVCAGLWWREASRRGRRLVDSITFMRIALPEVVFGIGLFLLLTELGLPLGMAAIVLGHVVFCSAYATIVIQARFAAMPDSYEQAAADLGAPPSRAFRRVTLPLLMPAVIVAALLSLTLSLDDVVTSQFLGGAEAETLPVYMLGKIRLNVSPEVNAIGTGFMLVTLLLFGALAAIGSRMGGLTASASGGDKR